MKKIENIKVGLALSLGFGGLAGIILAVQAATGLLAWYVRYHQFYSPTTYGVIALLVGALAGVGMSVQLKLNKLVSTLTAAGLALFIGAMAYGMGSLLHSNYFIEMTAVSAFVHGFLFFGGLGAIISALHLRD